MASLQELESALTKDFRRYHVAAQAQRLLGGSVSTFVVELAAGGTHDWSVKAVVAAAVGAVWTTARLQWPSVPWGLVTSHLKAAQGLEQDIAAPASGANVVALAPTAVTPTAAAPTLNGVAPTANPSAPNPSTPNASAPNASSPNTAGGEPAG